MELNDLNYVRGLIAAQVLKGPVLELGAGYGGLNCKETLLAAGFQYFGTDLHAAPGVDFVADFEKELDPRVFAKAAPFGSILVLNVLEHTFAPTAILDNCLGLLKSDGVLVVLTPCVWPLHNYPADVLRLNPKYYEQYALKRNLKLAEPYFQYVGFGRVGDFRDKAGNLRYPPPTMSRFHRAYSKAIHVLAHTTGSRMKFPGRVAVAAVFAQNS
jgi:SAM-dependent methyltransferase